MDDTLRVRVADFGLARVMHDLTTLTGVLACAPALATKRAIEMPKLWCLPDSSAASKYEQLYSPCKELCKEFV